MSTPPRTEPTPFAPLGPSADRVPADGPLSAPDAARPPDAPAPVQERILADFLAKLALRPDISPDTVGALKTLLLEGAASRKAILSAVTAAVAARTEASSTTDA